MMEPDIIEEELQIQIKLTKVELEAHAWMRIMIGMMPSLKTDHNEHLAQMLAKYFVCVRYSDPTVTQNPRQTVERYLLLNSQDLDQWESVMHLFFNGEPLSDVERYFIMQDISEYEADKDETNAVSREWLLSILLNFSIKISDDMLAFYRHHLLPRYMEYCNSPSNDSARFRVNLLEILEKTIPISIAWESALIELFPDPLCD